MYLLRGQDELVLLPLEPLLVLLHVVGVEEKEEQQVDGVRLTKEVHELKKQKAAQQLLQETVGHAECRQQEGKLDNSNWV